MAEPALTGGFLLSDSREVSLADLRNQILLGLVALLVLLNYGFMQIRFPLGIPIAEMGLIFSLVSINHLKVLPRFLKIGFALPIILWWVVGIAHILWDAGHYGFWAIRDGSHVIESLFLYVGFTFARNQKAMHWALRALPVFFIVVALYAMTYPLRDWLMPLSPSLSGTSGQPAPLLFMYTNTAMILIAGAAYFMNSYLNDSQKRSLAIAGAMITLALLLFPSRTIVLQILAFIIYFAFRLRGPQLKSLLTALAIPVCLLVLVSTLGISVNGRFGTEFTPRDYINLVLEIIPGFSGGDGQMFSSGTEGRLIWWTGLLKQITASPQSFMLGLGYGMPLIDFGVSGGVFVREPHNDLLSILARGGMVMLVLFIWFQTRALMRLGQLVRYYNGNARYSSFVTGLLFIIIGTLVTALGEAPFIMAFLAVPYYFVMGLLIRLYLLRVQYE